MGVKDFYCAVTPGCIPPLENTHMAEYPGPGKYTVLKTGDERSREVFDTQMVNSSPHGGVLNQVYCW